MPPGRGASYAFGRYTELFPLPLMGVNTSRVEGLPSYISRLAAAHGLSAVALCQRTIFPHIGGRFMHKAPATAWAGHRGVRLLYRTEFSAPIVEALADLTGQTNLEQTIRPESFKFVELTDHLQSVLWWCPACAEEGIRGSETFYFPALWSTVTYPICTIHSIAMIGECPNCGMKWHLMRSSSWGTHCCRCGQALVGNLAVRRGGEHIDKDSWEWIASEYTEKFFDWAAFGSEPERELFAGNIQRVGAHQN